MAEKGIINPNTAEIFRPVSAQLDFEGATGLSSKFQQRLRQIDMAYCGHDDGLPLMDKSVTSNSTGTAILNYNWKCPDYRVSLSLISNMVTKHFPDIGDVSVGRGNLTIMVQDVFTTVALPLIAPDFLDTESDSSKSVTNANPRPLKRPRIDTGYEPIVKDSD